MAPELCPAPRAWAALALGLGLGAVALAFAPHEALDWQPELALSEPWRLWTAALVHLSPMHLMANLLGCAAVAAFGIAARLPSDASWAWLAAWPLTQAALQVQPLLLHYAGLSGVLHAGVAVAALHLVTRAQGRQRTIGWAVFIGLAVKLWLERPWAGPSQWAPGWDIPLAPLAHLTGVASGLLCGAIAQQIARRRAPRRPQPM